VTPASAAILGSVLIGAWPARVYAEPARAELEQTDLEAWLATDSSEADSATSDPQLDEAALPPRRHGVVIEGSVGALGHLGDMRHVSPIAPWFRLQLGYELLDWLMLYGAADVALSSTSYAQRPPEKRGYALFGASAGARVAWQPVSVLGFYLQADAGLSSVDQDVLATYGYADADRLRPFVGGMLGIEWFQVSPHYALALYGGARDYVQNFERRNGSRPPIAWVAGLAIRYAL
jgi:hypothetical protein